MANPVSMLDRVAQRWNQALGPAPQQRQQPLPILTSRTPFTQSLMQQSGMRLPVLTSASPFSRQQQGMPSVTASFNPFSRLNAQFGMGAQNYNFSKADPTSVGTNPFGLPDWLVKDPEFFDNRYNSSWIKSKLTAGDPSTKTGSAGYGDASKASSGVEGVKQWDNLIKRVAQESGVPYEVIASIMAIESGGQNLGWNGTVGGLMQVDSQWWQSTADKYGGNLLDPYTNLRTAAEILKQGYDRHGQSWQNAAAYYFGNEGAFAPGGGYSQNGDSYGTNITTYVNAFNNNMAYFTGQTASTPQGGSAVSFASQVQGTPYVWGGADKNGFDCSGLTYWAYAQAGIELPRTAAEQYNATQRVSADQLRPGDLVFFSDGNSITHVGIYVGNGNIIDAPSEGKNVRTVSLNLPWYQQHLYGYGRVA